MSNKTRHPIQPLEQDSRGVLRFKQNKIVRDLLDHCSSRGFSLNDIACREYSQEDRVQLAQLIGYSLSGFGELSYVTDSDYEAASEMFHSGTNELETRLNNAELTLQNVREITKNLATALFRIDQSDLVE